MEDTFFEAIAKASQARRADAGAWEQALSAMKMKGSDTGAQARRRSQAC